MNQLAHNAWRPGFGGLSIGGPDGQAPAEQPSSPTGRTMAQSGRPADDGAVHGPRSQAMQLSPDLEALLRMGLAVLCGLAVGVNRAHHGNTPHPNRLRVHVLVGLSACLMVLAAGPDVEARSRAIQGVATGIGFLGAGEILVPTRPRKHAPPEVRGLSSACLLYTSPSPRD